MALTAGSTCVQYRRLHCAVRHPWLKGSLKFELIECPLLGFDGIQPEGEFSEIHGRQEENTVVYRSAECLHAARRHLFC